MLGYVNMAIGIAGIALTILSAPHLLGIGKKIPTEDLPGALNHFGSAIKSFSGILVLFTFMFLLALGMAMTLVPISESLGAINPVSTSVLVIICLIAASISLTLALHRSPLSIPGCIGTLGLGLIAYVTATESDTAPINELFGLFLFLFLASGVVALIIIAADSES